MPRPSLTTEALVTEARNFAEIQSALPVPELFGVTDGKAVGTHVEKAFKAYLSKKYLFQEGNSAKGIDFPELDIDVKVTSVDQPQSSSPFKSARQKIFGLGYALLVFVYDKKDDAGAATLDIVHTIFVEPSRTGDFQMTTGLKKILDNEGNADDLVAFMRDKNLPVDDIEANNIASDLLNAGTLQIGYLTISNALQWRLQYGRAITKAGEVPGITRVR
ncbi:restriction endonuclease [Archangium sp. Cb G35]|nr:restriction endonuclease [Archangium sp. Cb G35]